MLTSFSYLSSYLSLPFNNTLGAVLSIVTVLVVTSDDAGNSGTTIFTIDKTAPEFEGLDSDLITKDDFVVKAIDTNLKSVTVKKKPSTVGTCLFIVKLKVTTCPAPSVTVMTYFPSLVNTSPSFKSLYKVFDLATTFEYLSLK